MANLIPHYFISTNPVGWRCSECGKVFRPALDTSMHSSPTPDDTVRTQFAEHDCQAYLAEIQRKGKKGVAQ